MLWIANVKQERKSTEFVNNVVAPMNAQEGDKLPFCIVGREDGTFPCGTAYEKRGVAVDVLMVAHNVLM